MGGLSLRGAVTLSLGILPHLLRLGVVGSRRLRVVVGVVGTTTEGMTRGGGLVLLLVLLGLQSLTVLTRSLWVTGRVVLVGVVLVVLLLLLLQLLAMVAGLLLARGWGLVVVVVLALPVPVGPEVALELLEEGVVGGDDVVGLAAVQHLVLHVLDQLGVQPLVLRLAALLPPQALVPGPLRRVVNPVLL